VILTLTVNPSLDRTMEVDQLVRGTVHRVRAFHVHPGGKGVNVSRVLAANGYKTRAMLPAGPDGAQLASLLADEGIEYIRIPINGLVRVNTAIAEPDGTVTKFNEPGPALTPAEIDAVTTAVLETGEEATWVVLSGSLSPGLPENYYAILVRELHLVGTKVAVDSSGPAMTAALSAQPDLVKPNREELAEVTGRSSRTVGDVVDAAAALREQGPATVVASLGRDGAVLVGENVVAYGESPIETPRSTVGAGDSALAGFLAAGDINAEALREALAWGAAATSLPGSRMPRPEDIDRGTVIIHPEVARERLLSEKD